MKDNKRQFHGRNTDNRLKVKGQKPEKKPKGNFDPNKPKRPPSPFFIFLDDFRREFNEANPDNKSVGAVGKAAGKKWKSMTEEDKEPFAALARSKKSEYAMNIQEYNMKLATGTNTTTNETKTTTNETKTTGDAESDKPKSEVKTTGDAESDQPKSEVKITGDAESDKPKSEVNDEKEIGSATSDKESGSGEEKKGDDKEVGPGICV